MQQQRQTKGKTNWLAIGLIALVVILVVVIVWLASCAARDRHYDHHVSGTDTPALR